MNNLIIAPLLSSLLFIPSSSVSYSGLVGLPVAKEDNVVVSTFDDVESASAIDVSSGMDNVSFGEDGNGIIESGDGFLNVTDGVECTLGPISDNVAAIAAHCGGLGDQIYIDDVHVGDVVKETSDNRDIAYVQLNDSFPIDTDEIAKNSISKGVNITKRGSTTGVTTGVVLTPGSEYVHYLPYRVGEVNGGQAYITNMKVDEGDSGSPVFNDDGEAIGIVTSVIQDGTNNSAVAWL